MLLTLVFRLVLAFCIVQFVYLKDTVQSEYVSQELSLSLRICLFGYGDEMVDATIAVLVAMFILFPQVLRQNHLNEMKGLFEIFSSSGCCIRHNACDYAYFIHCFNMVYNVQDNIDIATAFFRHKI